MQTPSQSLASSQRDVSLFLKISSIAQASVKFLDSVPAQHNGETSNKANLRTD